MSEIRVKSVDEYLQSLKEELTIEGLYNSIESRLSEINFEILHCTNNNEILPYLSVAFIQEQCSEILDLIGLCHEDF